MSNYSNTFGGAAKDTANSTVLGADHDTQYEAIATMSATKLDTSGLRAAVEAATDSNVFTDDDHTALGNTAAVSTGIWTPELNGRTAGAISSAGTYIKIGDQVWLTGYLEVTTYADGSGSVISGLPFTSSNHATIRGIVTIGFYQNLATNVYSIHGLVTNNSTLIDLSSQTTLDTGLSTNNVLSNTGAYVYFSAQYTAV
jgi:hypothetical protein